MLLSGTAFLLADEAGDVPAGGTGGFFLDDIRHLSTWELLVDGRPLTVLSAQRDAASGESVLVPRPVRGTDPPFAVLRTQVLDGDALVERLRVRNLGHGPRVVEVRYRVAADFADQLELRGDRTYPKPGAHRAVRSTPRRIELEYRREDWHRVTTVHPDGAARCDDEGLTWRVALDAGAEDVLLVRASAGSPGAAPDAQVPDADAPDTHGPDGDRSDARVPDAGGPDARGAGASGAGASGAGAAVPAATAPALGTVERIAARRRARDDAFRAAFTLPAIADPRLERAVRTGIDALAALQIPAPGLAGERIAGAGAPWFLTLFGRDSLVTALAALPFTAAPAGTTLRALARHQGREHRPERCEEPGKIVHEVRSGELSRFGQVPYARFYGTVDATPLFLVLLGAHHERTGDAALARELEPAARAAVEWMERDGGLGERGFLVYPTDAPGLVHHGWKDSATAITFASGEPAEGPIAVVEAQGYAVDALTRTACLAREVWDDPAYADRLAGLADDLRRRLPAAFWLPEADFPAIALDGRGRRVDLLASNAGHLLWSGALDAREASAVAERLLGPEFASGWGLRTVAAGQPTYHPISYHQGSVWPHDTAIAVAGLARCGFPDHARRLAGGLLDAAERCGYVLPEVMAGFGAGEVPAPVPYPHSCSPQAWAAAAPLLLLDALTGR